MLFDNIYYDANLHVSYQYVKLNNLVTANMLKITNIIQQQFGIYQLQSIGQFKKE